MGKNRWPAVVVPTLNPLAFKDDPEVPSATPARRPIPSPSRRWPGALSAALLCAPLLWTLTGCGGAPATPPVHLQAKAEAPSDALVAAAESYYAAETPEAMRAAVEAAAAAGPERALYHEIAADLAAFEDRHHDALRHLILALQDTGADNAWILLHRLRAMPWTLAERAEVEALCRALMAEHPDHEIRALAAYTLTASAHMRGEQADGALLGWRPQLALIGTWNNDQGKGFEASLPPERALDPEARYPGQLVEIGWRQSPPTDHRGELPLDNLLTPNTWSIAYAAGAFQAQAGQYELRLSTGDPVKVWVDDVLVYQDERLHRQVFDGVVLPVTLAEGPHRVLIKTAQKTQDWTLGVRITAPAGAPVAPGALRRLPLGTIPVAQRPVEQALEPVGQIKARFARLSGGPIRKGVLGVSLQRLIGGRAAAASFAEGLSGVAPKSLSARYALTLALWDNGERGRTADTLAKLLADAGEALPLIALKQARFWRQQKLEEKSRKLLAEVVARHPKAPTAALQLAEIFEDEEWHEDQCQILAGLDEAQPQWPMVRLALAKCYESLRLYPKARGVYRDLLDHLANSAGALKALYWHALGNDDYKTAARLAQRLTQAWPTNPAGWQRLAEAQRRQGAYGEATATLQKLQALNPDDPEVYRRLGALAYQQQKKDAAVEAWQAALQRAPEDEKLANRLAWLAPEQQGMWAEDVPSEEDLMRAIVARQQITPTPGADMIYLRDDEVTVLKPDGSTINVITTVAHAVNEAGRDQLTRQRLRGGGRTRIFHAFAVGPNGERIEASSIRGRVVRFRQLSVGSTVVMQYRLDARPDGYLANHLARQWWFQLPGLQTRLGRWVLWAPEGTGFLEEKLGPVERTQKAVDGQIRVEWSARDMQPIRREPGMPTLHEIAAHVVVSTVPDWDTFWKWEEALLTDAFRETPELVALAKTIFEGAETPQEKIDRLQAWLMTEIRYQQDYEGHIAGVKPHAAPMVVARRYGDCKDKAVLFITLARLGGVEAHFALVRTRTAGPVRREVPMQQFNHAIVYVPSQPGVEQGRFYDPTVDALDVKVLRHDDQGTWSLVFDPYDKTHEWRQIPFQDPGMDNTEIRSIFTLNKEGDAEGEMILKSQGRIGERLRQAGRNPEKLSQLLQQQLGVAYPGGQIVDYEIVDLASLDRPAEVKLRFVAPGVARPDGDTLRLKAPVGWNPQSLFALSERHHPVLMGVPQTLSWKVDVTLPEGLTLAQLPAPATSSEDCLTLTRETSAAAERFSLNFTLVRRCERLPTEAYETYRKLSKAMDHLIEEDVVLESKGKGRRRRAGISGGGRPGRGAL